MSGNAEAFASNCVNCLKECSTGCARCLTRFCSFECQMKYWPKHRRECVKKIFESRGFRLKSQSKLESVQNESVSDFCKEDIKFQPKLESVQNESVSDFYKEDVKSFQQNIPVSSVKPIKYKAVAKEEPLQKIVITSFLRSNCVFIRDADDETTQRLNLLHQVVNKLGGKLSPITGLPKQDSFMIVKDSDSFKRCKILSAKGGMDRIKIFMNDTGTEDFVSTNQLFKPCPTLERLAETSFIRMLQLQNVPEFFLTKAAKYVKSLLSDDIYLELENGSEPGEGRIFDVVKNEFVNDVLICYAQAQEPPQLDEIEPEDKVLTYIPEEFIKIDSLNKIELPLETEISLMIYDNSQLEDDYIICCVDIDNLQDIKESKYIVHDYGIKNEDKTYKPEKDDVCIAFYLKKKKWSRAIFLGICEDKPREASVCFIDFGKTTTVSVEKIIKYPEAFSYIPNYLYTCRVYGLPQERNEELLDRLRELLPENSSVKAKSLSVVDINFHLIEMEDILKILASEDLI